MKSCKLIGVLLMLVTLVMAEETKKAFKVPTEIVLQSGTVLRQVKAQRWGSDHVVVKYVGGVAPIYFRHIKTPSTDVIEQWRELGEQKTVTSPLAIGRTITGQVFVTTAGAGTYKFSNAEIIAFPAAIMDLMIEYQKREMPTRYAGTLYTDTRADAYIAWRKTMAKFIYEAIASTVSDAEGNYALPLKNVEPAAILGFTTRLIGKSTEYNAWFVKTESSSIINLTNYNLWSQPE